MIARPLWRWTRTQLLAHQQHELTTLRAWLSARSPFYRQLHRNLAHASLGELPVLTKAMLMDNFDQISTDPTLRLQDLQAYLDDLHTNDLFAECPSGECDGADQQALPEAHSTLDEHPGQADPCEQSCASSGAMSVGIPHNLLGSAAADGTGSGTNLGRVALRACDSHGACAVPQLSTP
jgi:hypothetical protein